MTGPPCKTATNGCTGKNVPKFKNSLCKTLQNTKQIYIRHSKSILDVGKDKRRWEKDYLVKKSNKQITVIKAVVLSKTHITASYESNVSIYQTQFC